MNWVRPASRRYWVQFGPATTVVTVRHKDGDACSRCFQNDTAPVRFGRRRGKGMQVGGGALEGGNAELDIKFLFMIFELPEFLDR